MNNNKNNRSQKTTVTQEASSQTPGSQTEIQSEKSDSSQSSSKSNDDSDISFNINTTKNINSKVWSFMFGHLKPFTLPLVSHIFALVFFGIYCTIFPYFVSQLVNDPASYFYPIMNIIYVTVFAVLAFRVYHYSVWYYALPLLQENLSNHILSAMMAHNHEFYQENLSGDLSKKRTDMIAEVPSIYLAITEGFILNAILVIAALISLHSLPIKYIAGIFVWIASFIGGSMYYAKTLDSLSAESAVSDTQLNGSVSDILHNISAVKLFNRKPFEMSRFDKQNKENRIIKQKLEYIYFLIFSFYGVIFTTVISFSLWGMMCDYEKKLITIGDIALFIQITTLLVSQLWKVTEYMQKYITGLGRLRAGYLSLMQSGIILKTTSQKLTVPAGEIVFDNVTFSYKTDNNPDSILFNNLSVKIKAGEKVGLVGYSGGGKSSFVNLILGLYTPNIGKILIDQQNIFNVTDESINENISIIPQDPALFNRTVYENISYGNLDALYNDVITASKQAQAHEFIMDLEDQYDTMVGEKGSKLSGGQRQRVVIARALLKNSRIIILDEVTSQLDSINEEKIQQQLFELLSGRTTLIIAHRLSTLKHVDRLLVFDKGKIVGDGTHEELIKTNKLYQELWYKQVGN